MTVSSILHEVVAFESLRSRSGNGGSGTLNTTGKTQTTDGNAVELRAFVHRVTRSIVAFEWDLNANTAILQISQLPDHSSGMKRLRRVSKLISAWLDISRFSIVDLRP